MTEFLRIKIGTQESEVSRMDARRLGNLLNRLAQHEQVRLQLIKTKGALVSDQQEDVDNLKGIAQMLLRAADESPADFTD